MVSVVRTSIGAGHSSPVWITPDNPQYSGDAGNTAVPFPPAHEMVELSSSRRRSGEYASNRN
jgi:hypothetical protein